MTNAIKYINEQFNIFFNKNEQVMIDHRKVLGERYNNPTYTSIYYEFLTDGMLFGNLWKDVESKNPNGLIYVDKSVGLIAIDFLRHIQEKYEPFNKRDLEACIIELRNIAYNS